MEVPPERLLEIFRAGFRLGQTDTVVSNEEMETDARSIIFNILGFEFSYINPRQGGRTEQIKRLWNSIVSGSLTLGSPTRGAQAATIRRDFSSVLKSGVVSD